MKFFGFKTNKNWECHHNHPSVINNGKECKICGCKAPNSSQLLLLSQPQFWLFISSSIIIASSLIIYGVYQLIKPCPPDTHKKGLKCIPINLFTNPDSF